LPSDLLPEDEEMMTKIMVMQAADNDYNKFQYLWNEVKISEIYEHLALQNAMNYRQNLTEDGKD
jgi:hypothetical protein